jgi:hypothetical protein
MIMPVKKESSTTIAKDASKCQDRKETATGAAFCAEKTATSILMMTTMALMLPPSCC